MDRWVEALSEDPVLETERLTLRALREDDAESFFEYASDPEVARFVTFGPHTSLAESRALVARLVAMGPESGSKTWAIVLRDEGKMIGTCGIYMDDARTERANVAYALNRSYWGHGYMTEAVHAVIAFGFERLGLNRIQATCLPDNAASARVMEKAGMSYEGILREYGFMRGSYRDLKIYSILKREWSHAP